jgi:hypothetical protein
MRTTLRFQLAIITLAALAATWFWAIPPILTSVFYLHSSNGTEADLVNHFWHFRLVQPQWVSSPPQYDYLRWAQVETLARLGLVFLGWLGSSISLLRWHLLERPGPHAQPACFGGPREAAVFAYHAGAAAEER